MEDYENRTRNSHRKCTDLPWLIFCTLLLITTSSLIIYSLTQGSLNRLLSGYDDCGNLCGQLNSDNIFYFCNGHDKREFPLLRIESTNDSSVHYSCVKTCPADYETFLNRCWRKSEEIKDFKAFVFVLYRELSVDWSGLLLIFLTALTVSITVLLLFRFKSRHIVWMIFLLLAALTALESALLWTFFRDNFTEFLASIVTVSVAVLLLTIAVIFFALFKHKIPLVAELYKETSRALISMPLILLEPLLTVLWLTLALTLFNITMVSLEFSGTFINSKTPDGRFQVSVQQDPAIVAAKVFAVLSFLWFANFTLDCQNFVISGAVSKWYFKTNKPDMNESFYNLLRFHLGSVCFGALVLPFVKISQIILSVLQIVVRSLPFGDVLESLIEFMKHLACGSYVFVAKEGTPFLKSAERAFKVRSTQVVSITELHGFGRKILMSSKLLIIATSLVILGGIMKHPLSHWKMVADTATISVVIAHSFMSVYEVTVDTIFFCFCEDFCENDGMIRPHHMSEELWRLLNGAGDINREIDESQPLLIDLGNASDDSVRGIEDTLSHLRDAVGEPLRRCFRRQSYEVLEGVVSQQSAPHSIRRFQSM